MTIHEITLLDLPRLITIGQREDLDGIHKYIHAKNHNFSDLLSTSLPFTTHIGARVQQDGQEFAAGMRLDEQRLIARMSFITPAPRADSSMAQTLFEHLLTKAGERQMISVSAETSNPEVAAGLKSAGFSTYFTQNIWGFHELPARGDTQIWQLLKPGQHAELIHYYAQVTPPMIQFLEVFPPKNAKIFRSIDQRSYCVVRSGTSGMMLMPYFQPEDTQGIQKLHDLIKSLRINLDQQIFILTRSTMGWIDPIVEALGAEFLEEQNVTFKRLANPVPQTEPATKVNSRDARMLPTSIKERSALITDPKMEQNRNQ